MKRVLIGALAVVATFQCQAAVKFAPDILHYDLRSTALTNNILDPDAAGIVSGNVRAKGSVENQLLKVSLTQLDANANYTLVAFVNDSVIPTVVTNFVTSSNGSYAVIYWKRTHGKHPGQPLPVTLDPVSNIREFQVINSTNAIVLEAMVINSNRISYATRRNMENTGFISNAVGSLLVSGYRHRTHLRLISSGLTPLTQYVVAINGTIASTNTSDSKGRLTLKKLPIGSPNFIDIKEVALADLAGNIILISTGLGIPGGFTTLDQQSVALNTSANFAVLAGAAVTSTGNTVVTGDLGVWAGTDVSGFDGIVPGGPGIVNGTIHAGDVAAQTAQGDLTTAYNDAAGRTLAPVDVANADLGGLTLAPGLYKSSGTLALTGNLTLNAQGNANGVFIFQVASSLDTASGSQVILTGGAKAANVFWQVGSSATLATTTVFKGTIMADQSISLATGATLEGRALARIGSVTMDSNIITIPAP